MACLYTYQVKYKCFNQRKCEFINLETSKFFIVIVIVIVCQSSEN